MSGMYVCGDIVAREGKRAPNSHTVLNIVFGSELTNTTGSFRSSRLTWSAWSALRATMPLVMAERAPREPRAQLASNRKPHRDERVREVAFRSTPSPKQALAEVTRVLSPRGVILVAVPNLNYWKGQYRRQTYMYFRPDDLGQQHYVYYSAETLGRLLEESGFDVKSNSKAFFHRRYAAETFSSAISETARFCASLALLDRRTATWRISPDA